MYYSSTARLSCYLMSPSCRMQPYSPQCTLFPNCPSSSLSSLNSLCCIPLWVICLSTVRSLSVSLKWLWWSAVDVWEMTSFESDKAFVCKTSPWLYPLKSHRWHTHVLCGKAVQFDPPPHAASKVLPLLQISSGLTTCWLYFSKHVPSVAYIAFCFPP